MFQPLIEVFLLVEQPRQRLSHWSRELAPLDAPPAPPTATVDAYFDPLTNQAIFGLRYDQLALGPARLDFLLEVARLAEIAVVEPDKLSAADRQRFVADRLAGCTVHVGDQRTIVSALVELVRRVRAQRSTTRPPSNAVSAILPHAASALSGEDARLLAKGTRKLGGPGEQTSAAPRSSAQHKAVTDFAQGSVRQRGIRATAQIPEERPDFDETGEKQVMPEPIAPGQSISQSMSIMQALPRREPGARPSANVVARPGVHRAETVLMTPSQTRQMLEVARQAAYARGAEAFSEAHYEAYTEAHYEAYSTAHETHHEARPAQHDTRPVHYEARSAQHDTRRVDHESRHDTRRDGAPIAEVDTITEQVPLLAESSHSGVIHGRYLRSGRWVPVRFGALSLKGAVLTAGALPRVEDRVEVALAYGDHRALVGGAVSKISSAEEIAATGATTFTVAFELDDGARRELTALLTAARAANVTIKPPPARSARRFLVEWPLFLGTVRGAVRGEAHDVSAGGMFVRPLHALPLDTTLSFTIVLDDGQLPVSGRAQVIRGMSDADARASGHPPGYGLAIVEMTEEDRARWYQFVARVAQRSTKRVLVAADPAQLVELQGGLVAAGYTAVGASDRGAIAAIASAGARPIDAALIDAAWLGVGNTPLWVESLFAQHRVPFIAVNGDGKRGRTAIDRLLAVV